MRRALVFLCVVLPLALGWTGIASLAIAAKKSAVIKPVPGSPAVRVRTGGKVRLYHSASAAKPLEYRIRGPRSIRILTRCGISSPSETKATIYHIAVTVDGLPLTSKTLSSMVSSSAKGDAGVPLGALKKIVVRVPPGEHVIRIIPADPNPVLVRMLTGTGKTAPAKLIPFEPERYVKAVRLMERDLETTVYRFTPSQPIGLTILGPLPLRVTTRLDFGSTNGVTQNYLLKVTMDGKPLKAFALKSAASHTATYPDLSEITPGRARSIDLNVPRGNHQIVITLDGTTAEGASMRIEIPQRESRAGAQ